jgi:hypothetical protein
LDSLNLYILNGASLPKKLRDAARLSKESLVYICPNPKCQKKIEEPILLTILSVTPPKEYEACPYCFSKLQPEPPMEQMDVSEFLVDQEEIVQKEYESNLSVNPVLEKVKDSGPRLLQKVKALIADSEVFQKEKKEKLGELQAEAVDKKEEEKATKKESKTESFVEEDQPKEEAKTEPSAKRNSESKGCPESFGYLANRPADTPIPSQCLVCPKMVDCMLSPRESETH